jgi:hypothetical protein
VREVCGSVDVYVIEEDLVVVELVTGLFMAEKVLWTLDMECMIG